MNRRFVVLLATLAVIAGILPQRRPRRGRLPTRRPSIPACRSLPKAPSAPPAEFEGSSGVYIGQAAHCSGTGGATETDGCTSGSHPIGTPVGVTGASRAGTLAYSSWIAMQASGETNPIASPTTTSR